EPKDFTGSGVFLYKDEPKLKSMKIQYILSGCLFLLPLTTVFAQQPSAAVPQKAVIGTLAPSEPSTLTKFDLDFAGGSPDILVSAIQKASGRPLNVIIPEEFAGTQLPALKMKSVDVSQLFSALSASSAREEVVH